MEFKKKVLKDTPSKDVSLARFRKTKLRNGLTVLFEKRDVDVTTVMLGVRYGSGYDSVEEKGMAHFIEHLCFKGTEKRSALEIVQEIESVGGEVNAFTSEEVTAYFTKLPPDHLGLAMDVIFDIFFNATFPEEEVAREASVICEEIKMYKDSPRGHALNMIKENLYEEPFGIFGTGRAEVVQSLTRERLLKKHRNVYVPANSVLCVVGNNNFDEVVSLAEKLSVVRDAGEKLEVPEIVLRNIKNEEHREALEQANVVIGFHFPKVSESLNAAAEIFSTILGEGMSSKLFTEVREKRGLVYGVKSEIDSGRDFGYLIIWAGTDPSKIGDVKKICLEEFGKIGEISQEELDRAKVQVIGNRKVESEGSSETAVNLIKAEICGRAEDYYEFENEINSVTLDEIRELASKTEYAFFSLGP